MMHGHMNLKFECKFWRLAERYVIYIYDISRLRVKDLCSTIYCNLLKSMDLTNREKASKCLATSSSLVLVE